MAQFLAAAAAHSSDSQASMLPLEIVLVVIGIAIGRVWGRRSGLKHLGQSEFKSRWNTVRKIRRW